MSRDARVGVPDRGTLSVYLMALLYIAAGINHFRVPAFYLHVMPPYLPWPVALNLLSGGIEIALGFGLLWRPARAWSAYGVIALLIAITPVHVYMLSAHAETFSEYSLILLWLRLPLQVLLGYWAWTCARLELGRREVVHSLVHR